MRRSKTSRNAVCALAVTSLRDGERKTWNCALLLLRQTMTFIVRGDRRQPTVGRLSRLIRRNRENISVAMLPRRRRRRSDMPQTMISDPVIVTLGRVGRRWLGSRGSATSSRPSTDSTETAGVAASTTTAACEPNQLPRRRQPAPVRAGASAGTAVGSNAAAEAT